MAQYKQVKEKYKDCILMFRLGDFYEMFFEDAVEASKILQITLTARRNKNSDLKVPMCGIPYHALESYLSKITKAGRKAAICDQITEPNGKGIVEREVMRVVTPGTTFDENIIDQKANNYAAAIVAGKDCFGFAYVDVTTGQFKCTEINNAEELRSEVLRISPAECVCGEELLGKLKTIFRDEMYIFKHEFFGEAESMLKEAFDLKSLQPFGMEGRPAAINASGVLFDYLKETQKAELKHIQKISFYRISDFMPLDESLIRNLELFYTNRENKKEGSLIWVLDRTMTPMGGRMLRNWLLHPLPDEEKIKHRLDKVGVFVKNSGLLRDIRECLKDVYDVERLLSRLSLGTGNARDLIAMKQSLKSIPKIKDLLGENISDISSQLDPLEELIELVEKAIEEEPPISVREGGMIKKGFNEELDDLKKISTEGKTFLRDLQEREAKRTGISSLKVKYNKVFGYYIEISKSNLSAVPEDYIRKQTLVNAERFITPELKEYEEKILNAEDRICEIEYELFYGVRMEVVKEIIKIQNNARMIAALDVLSNLAFVAVKNNYCKPEIVENASGGFLEIIGGRHPVIEQMSLGGDFVPNDCKFDEEKKFLLITGPNMGGKSTYLRQTAIIVLMAQIGSFVPAEKVVMSPVDRIFTRVGASDNLARGESTFMVEMTEASYILNNATEKSLIILDELGRGTSTYDGVSIAWAITEFLHDEIGAKTLFATHYHELIELADQLSKAKNLSVAVKETEKDGVVFLYKVVEGGVDKSYGIEVAKLAGLPVNVVGRARGVLNELEEGQSGTKRARRRQTFFPTDQAELFDPIELREHKKIIGELGKMDTDNMTPIEALEKLVKIKSQVAKD